MNARNRWLIVAVALLIPIAAWAQAQGDRGGMRRPGRGDGMRGGMHGMRHGGFMARWADLDLTEEQRDKIRDLHDAQARKAVQRRADIQLARLDLHKLMREERPNSASVSMAINNIARLHADGLKARFETHMQARALLTPEQRQKLLEGGVIHKMGDWEL